MTPIQRVSLVVLAAAELSCRLPSANAALVYYQRMEGTGPTLSDDAPPSLGMTAFNSGHVYQEASVPAGTYGALTVSGSQFGYSAGLGSSAAGWNSVTGANELNGLVNNFTVMAWVMPHVILQATGPTDFQATQRILSDDYGVSSPPTWGFGLFSDRVRFTRYNIVDIDSDGGVVGAAGQWHHIAVTVSSLSGTSFYVNGNAAGSDTSTAARQDIASGTGRFVLLAENSSGYLHLDGLADEIRVYDSVLSVDAIRAAAVASINVNSNNPPTLVVPAAQMIERLATLTVTNSALDVDVPAQTLTFGLVSAPTGVSLNPSTGVLTWTPTEAQGPSTNVIVVKVTDNGSPSLSATNSFVVVVTEASGPPVALDVGLVAYYPMNGNANDESGNGNSGTVFGATLTSNRWGRADSAYSFDGVDDYIGIGSAPSLKMTEALSISTWVRVDSFTSLSGYQNIIGDHAPNELTQGPGKYLRFANSRLQFLVGGIYGFGTGVYVSYDFNAAMLGTWQHVAGTYDRTTVRLYLNGVQVASRPYTLPLTVTTNPLLIGKSAFPDEFLHGVLDDLRIYNRALTDAEVRQLASTGRPSVVSQNPDGLLTHSFDTMRFQFNEPMDAASFSLSEDLPSFDGPEGTVQPTGFSWLDDATLRIMFPPQTKAGVYQMVIGPLIFDKEGKPMDQDGDEVRGEPIDDQYVALLRITGPRVLSHSPSGDKAAATSAVSLLFDRAMDTNSFSVDEDVESFTTPGGLIRPSGFSWLDSKTLRIEFAAQAAAGQYRMVIGPQILDLGGNGLDQDQDTKVGEVPDDQYVATFGIQAPQIVSSQPSGALLPPVSSIRLSFSQAMNTDSFSLADIADFKGPQGTIALKGYSWVDSQTLEIAFGAQSALGAYRMIVGPQILDLGGNALDQDQDSEVGEVPDDQYTASFTLAYSGTLTQNTTWGPELGVIIVNGAVVVPANLSLSLQAGTIVKFAKSSSITVQGTLSVNGTPEKPVIFTSVLDDSVGGDSNGDGTNSVPSVSAWSGIRFVNEDLTSTLDHFDIRYANEAVNVGDYNGWVHGHAVLQHGALRNNAKGIMAGAAYGELLVQDCLITGNELAFQSVGTAGLTFRNCTIAGNKGAGSVGHAVLTIENSIVAFNAAGLTGWPSTGDVETHLSIFYSPVGDIVGWIGQQAFQTNGNLTVEPLFVARTSGNYELAPGSPAVDIGSGVGALDADLLGRPRHDDLGMPNSGKGFPAYVDLGAFERQEDTASADLAIAVVSKPTPEFLNAGDSFAVQWTIANVGLRDAVGSWEDVVYLSRDPSPSSDDVVLVRRPHSGTVVAGASYTDTLTNTIPAGVSGLRYILVRTDATNALHDPVEMNNVMASAGVLAISLPAMNLDQGATGTIQQDEWTYVRFDSVAGRTIILNLDAAAPSGSVALYARYGQPPTQAQFDSSAVIPSRPDQQARILTPMEGAYYVGIYGDQIPGGSTSFTLTAQQAALNIRAVTPNRIGNAGCVTLKIEGDAFDPGAQVQLVGGGGGIIGGDVFFQDAATLFATFDLAGAGAQPGSYAVVVINPGPTMTSRNDALTVEAAAVQQFWAHLTVPGATRPGRVIEVRIDYGNSGNLQIPSPILTLTNTASDCEWQLPGDEAWVVGSEFRVLGLSSDGPPTVLRPGQSETITVRLKVPFRPEPLYTSLFSMGAIPTDGSNLPIDWSRLEQEVRPGGMDDTTWAPIFARLKAQLGHTWGDYAAVLRRNAERWFAAGRRLYSVRQLFGMELDEAYGLATGILAGRVIQAGANVPATNGTVRAENVATGARVTGALEANGDFALYGLAAGQHLLSVSQYLAATGQVVNLPVDQDLVDVLVVVTNGGRLTGRVATAKDGRPIAGAGIMLNRSGGGFSESKITDSDGCCEFGAVPFGAYVVQCFAAGYLDAPPASVAVSAPSTPRLSFAMVAGGAIAGTVTHAVVGAPLYGATVRLSGETTGHQDLAQTDAQGRYQFLGLPADVYSLDAAAFGYLSSQTSGVALAVEQVRTNVNMALNTGAALQVRLLDAVSNQAIDGAEVWVSQTNGGMYSGMSNAAGLYLVAGLRYGEWQLSAWHPQYQPPDAAQVNVSAGQTNTYTFELSPGASLTGVVTNLVGAPVSNATVIATGPSGSASIGTTDTFGRYGLTGLGAGVHTIRIAHEDYATVTGTTPALTPGGPPVHLSLGLAVGQGVFGHVRDVSTGQPIAGASVTFFGNDGTVVSLATDVTGAFGGSNFNPGPYYVHVYAEGYCSAQRMIQVPISGALTNLDFGPTVGATVTGTVMTAVTSKSVPDAAVQLLTAEEGIVLSAQTDAAGRFELTNVPLRQYSVRVLHDTYSFASRDLVITSEPPTSLHLATATNELHGTLTEAGTGAPIHGARVSAIYLADDMQTVHAATGADGVFLFPSLLSGQYMVVAEADGYGMNSEAVALPRPGNAALLVSLAPGSAVVGTIIDAGNGQAVSNAVVFARPTGLTNLEAGVVTQTASNGQYFVTGLAAGSYDVTIAAAGYVVTNLSLTVPSATQDIALSRTGYTVCWRFVDRDSGLPLAAMSGLVLYRELPIAGFVTDSSGTAFLGELDVGTYSIRLLPPGPSWAGTAMVSGDTAADVLVTLWPDIPSGTAASPYSGIASLAEGPTPCNGTTPFCQQCQNFWRSEIRARAAGWALVKAFTFTMPVCSIHGAAFMNKREEVVTHRNDIAVLEILADYRWWTRFVGPMQGGGVIKLDARNYRFSREDGKTIVETCLRRGTADYGDYLIPPLGKYTDLFHGIGIFDITEGFGGIEDFYIHLANARVPNWNSPAALYVDGHPTLRFTVKANATFHLLDYWKMLHGGEEKYEEERWTPFLCLQDCWCYPPDYTETYVPHPFFSALADLPALTLTILQTEGGTVSVANYEHGAGVNRSSDDFWFTKDTTVYCNAAPDPGWRFVRWDNGPTVQMFSDQQVSAVFEKEEEEEPENPGNPHGGEPTYPQTSVSPEDKWGPAGYDALGTAANALKRYIQPGQTMAYRIEIWNKPEAPVPTQDATIDDTLDPELFDLNTLEFTRVGFLKWDRQLPGGQVVDLRIDTRPDMNIAVDVKTAFNSQTGQIRWWFHTVDPLTGDYPADPSSGFLPRYNPATGYEIGWVEYRVKARGDLPTGTVITNQALVQFDFLGPFGPAPKEGPWLNTIDAAAPSSSVLPLPATTAEQFTVQWWGQDDAGGSGLVDFDIYVKDNDGDWTLWKVHTTDTSADFMGQPGHTYAFYSVARDGVGHLEPAPAIPDAVTRVPPILGLRVSEAGLTFTWPVAAPGFVLESTDSLEPPIEWLPVSNAPVVVGGVSTLSMEPTNAAAFYRLRQP